MRAVAVICFVVAAFATVTSDYTMKVICDDQMTLWVDGEQTDVAGQGAWNQMSTLTIRPSTRVLGIKCRNTGGPYGIMGAVQDEAGNDVLVTDNSWSCSNTADDGWEKADFLEGDNWNAASYYPHRNYVTNSGSWASMSPNRQIIWTATAADTTVYCRKSLRGNDNFGKYAGKYLSAYSSGVSKYDNLVVAQAECLKRSDCGGVTYEPYSGKYTLRQGTELKPSPTAEISWKINPYASGVATTALVKDLGCWKDTAVRAIAPVEGQFDNLKDNYIQRSNSMGKCLSATMCLANSVFSLQNGGWCATTPTAQDTYKKFGPSDTCRPDGEGGPWGNQVYQVDLAVDVSDYTFKVICDDVMTLWVDGDQKDVAGQGAWNQMSTLTIPSTTQVLAIKCRNGGGPYGIMGAVQDADGNDVLVTDNSWSCSNSGDDGWEKADFKEGDNWNSASYYAHRNYVTNSGSWASMSPNRQIIWTDSAADTTVYCRKVIQRPAIAAFNVESLGCWKDTANRAIAPIEGTVSTLKDNYIARTDSFDKCLRATLALGNKVFSLQNGGWCATAADAEDTYDKYGPIETCRDDGEGGPWGNQVYRINC